MRLSPESAFYRHYASESLSICGDLMRPRKRRGEHASSSLTTPFFYPPSVAVWRPRRNMTEALDTQRQAIALDPKCWQAHRELRNTLLELHRAREGPYRLAQVAGTGPS